jgi:hypothetical protein
MSCAMYLSDIYEMTNIKQLHIYHEISSRKKEVYPVVSVKNSQVQHDMHAKKCHGHEICII